MEEYISRIKSMYNACAKNFGQYLADYDMESYNNRSEEIVKRYGCTEDIKNLILWFAPKVQTIHDVYTGVIV
jgi:hypothetical protein